MSFRTLYDLLHDSARHWPDRIAIGSADHDRTLSYRDLAALVDQLASQLRRLGVDESDTIAILADNCVELVLALFAITSTGAAALPVNPALTLPEIASKLTAASATMTIVPDHLYDPLANASATMGRLSLQRSADPIRATILVSDNPDKKTTDASTTGVAHRSREGDVALMLFTTGTTSGPKIVPLTHANLSASVDGTCATYRLSPDDATLLVMPLFHGHGLIGGLLATLASGGAAYMPSGGRFSASKFWTEMAGIHATWYSAVPTIHQILLARAAAEYPNDRPPPLRFIRSCSAPMTQAVLRDVESAFRAPVITAYGMTETAHQATSNPLPAVGRCKAESVGLAAGLEIQILGLDGRVTKPGIVGEVCVRGAALTAGYLHEPEANAASFVGGWFHTGDLGYQDDDGYLFLQGRIKEIINRGGEKISPYSVDVVLAGYPKVEDAMSFGIADETYGEEIAAAIILKPGESATERELQHYALTKLSAFEVPKRFYFVRDLPRTAKGAGDRRKLAAMFANDSSQEDPIGVPARPSA